MQSIVDIINYVDDTEKLENLDPTAIKNTLKVLPAIQVSLS